MGATNGAEGISLAIIQPTIYRLSRNPTIEGASLALRSLNTDQPLFRPRGRAELLFFNNQRCPPDLPKSLVHAEHEILIFLYV